MDNEWRWPLKLFQKCSAPKLEGCKARSSDLSGVVIAHNREDAQKFFHDPFGYVLYAFQWGEGDLAEFDGPNEWQRDQLEDLAAEFEKNPLATIQDATSSSDCKPIK